MDILLVEVQKTVAVSSLRVRIEIGQQNFILGTICILIYFLGLKLITDSF